MRLQDNGCLIGPFAENAKTFLQHVILNPQRVLDGHLAVVLSDMVFEITALVGRSYEHVDFFASDALAHSREAERLCRLKSPPDGCSGGECSNNDPCEGAKVLSRSIVPILAYYATLAALASENADVDLKWLRVIAEMRTEIHGEWAWLRLAARISLEEAEKTRRRDLSTMPEIAALSEKDKVRIWHYVSLHRLAREDDERMLSLHPLAIDIVFPVGVNVATSGREIVTGVAGSAGFRIFNSGYSIATRISWYDANLATWEALLQRQFQIHGSWEVIAEGSIGIGGRLRIDSPVLGLGVRVVVRIYKTARISVGAQFVEMPGVARLLSLPVGLSF
jgi:hypothetical protein